MSSGRVRLKESELSSRAAADVGSSDAVKGRFRIADYCNLQRLFEDNLPLESLKDMPRRVMLGFGTMSYVIFIGAFVYFLVDAFLKRLNESYISLDRGSGQCADVERSLTGTYYATHGGVWQGDADFRFSDAVYRFDFNDLRVDKRRFRRLIGEDFSIKGISRYFQDHDLANNLIAWMHYKQQHTVNGKLQFMTMATEPSDVFSRRRYYAAVIDADRNTCEAEEVTYQAAAAKFHLKFAAAGCRDLLRTVTNGYATASGAVSMTIDVNTYTVVAALNLGILKMTDLELVDTYGTINIYGVPYLISALIDPRYPRSSVIYCVTSDSQNAVVDQLCMLETDKEEGVLPFLFHSDPYCSSCSSGASNCRDFNLTAGFLYTNNTFLPSGAFDDDGQDDDYYYVDDDKYDNTWVYEYSGLEVIIILYRFISMNEFKTLMASSISTNDTSLFDICPNCRLLFINILDDQPFVTSYAYQLEDGHCEAHLDISNYRTLARSTPVRLTERFFECRDTIYGAVLEATGVAFGNMEVFGTLALCLLLVLAFAAAKFAVVETADNSDEDSKIKEVLKEFGRKLLSLRKITVEGSSIGQHQSGDLGFNDSCSEDPNSNVRQLIMDGMLTEADIRLALLLKKVLVVDERREAGSNGQSDNCSAAIEPTALFRRGSKVHPQGADAVSAPVSSTEHPAVACDDADLKVMSVNSSRHESPIGF